MNDQPLTAAPDRPRSKAHLLAKLHRYKNLLRKKWWVLIVGVILGLGTEAVRSRFDRPVFSSMGKMIMTPKLNIADATLYAEELSNFLGTQSELMRGEVVIGRAHARVSAQKPDLAPQPVSLSVSGSPTTTIFVPRATGDNPQYTQAFLQACMDEFISWKNDLKVGLSDTTVSRLMENVLRLEKELTRCDEELTAFQSTNKMVITAETANAAGGYLGVLQQELARKKSDYALLKDLTLDQALEHQQEKPPRPPARRRPPILPNPPQPRPASLPPNTSKPSRISCSRGPTSPNSAIFLRTNTPRSSPPGRKSPASNAYSKSTPPKAMSSWKANSRRLRSRLRTARRTSKHRKPKSCRSTARPPNINGSRTTNSESRRNMTACN